MRSKILILLLGLFALLPGRSPAARTRYANWTMHAIDSAAVGQGGSLDAADGILFADVDGDGDLDATSGYHDSGKVRACLNPGTASATSYWSCVTTGSATGVEESVFVDVDGDGNYD